MRPMLKFLPNFSSSSLVRTSHWKIYDPFQYTSLHSSFASLVVPTKSKLWLTSEVFIQGYSRRRFTCLPTFITLFPFSLQSLIMVRSFVLSSLSLLFLASDVFSKPVVTKPIVIIPSCPAANGLKYDTPAGTCVVQCSVSSGGQNIHTGHAVANFQTCLDQCGSTPKYVAVTYETSSRTCILKSTFGASTPNTRAISAGLHNGTVAVPAPVVVQSLSVGSSSKCHQQYASASILRQLTTTPRFIRERIVVCWFPHSVTRCQPEIVTGASVQSVWRACSLVLALWC
jgi:hypothetical protein